MSRYRLQMLSEQGVWETEDEHLQHCELCRGMPCAGSHEQMLLLTKWLRKGNTTPNLLRFGNVEGSAWRIRRPLTLRPMPQNMLS